MPGCLSGAQDWHIANLIGGLGMGKTWKSWCILVTLTVSGRWNVPKNDFREPRTEAQVQDLQGSVFRKTIIKGVEYSMG